MCGLNCFIPKLMHAFQEQFFNVGKTEQLSLCILLSSKWMGKMHVVTLSGIIIIIIIIVSIGNSAHVDVCFSTLVSTIWWISLDIYIYMHSIFGYIYKHSICFSNNYEKRLVLNLSCSFTTLKDTINSWVLLVEKNQTTTHNKASPKSSNQHSQSITLEQGHTRVGDLLGSGL